MREIIFRGKRFDDGKWEYGWLCEYPFGRWPLKCAIIPKEDANDGYHHFEQIDPETVGEYTGLKDTNGNRIFEGDIVRGLEDSRSFEVRYDAGEFCFFLNDTWYDRLDSYSARSCIVLGNIYDNQEMTGGVE